MKQKLLVNVIFFMMISLHVCAQNEELNVYDYFKKSYSQSQTTKMWYVSVGGGPSLLMANQDGAQPLSERITYGGEISVGKWFTPVLGARLQFYGGKYRGVNYAIPRGGSFTDPNLTNPWYPRDWQINGDNNGKYKFTKDGNYFFQEFTSFAAFLDFTVNITRLANPHSEAGKFNAIGFIGVGYALNKESVTNPETDIPGFRFGGRINYDLKKDAPWSIYLEGNGSFFGEKYDGYIGDRGFDTNANVMIGLQYKF